MTIRQETRYPWTGRSSITVSPKRAAEFASAFASPVGLGASRSPAIFIVTRVGSQEKPESESQRAGGCL